MKVIVDWNLCESNAVCMTKAPEVFLVDEEDELQVLMEEIPEDLRAKVEAAVTGCPKAALTISD